MNARDVEKRAHAAGVRLMKQYGPRYFALTDVFDHDTWLLILRSGMGPRVIDGLVRAGVDMISARSRRAVSLAIVQPWMFDDRMTDGDLELANLWLIAGLANVKGERYSEPGITVAARGWGSDPMRVTSLCLAVLAVATSTAARCDAQRESKGEHTRVNRSGPSAARAS